MLDETFEFDAPKYYDFASEEPESPSRSDAWFDNFGRGGGSESMVRDAAEGQGDGATVREADRPSSPGSLLNSKLVNEGRLAASRCLESAAAPTPPTNLVTSWSQAPAQRVLACQTDRDPGTDTGQASAPWQACKRTGFITPRRQKPISRTEGHAEKQQEISAAGGRKNARGATVADSRPAKRQKLHLPASGMPKLATSARSRPPKYKGKAHLEAEQMAAVPKFKANPIRHGQPSLPRAQSLPPPEAQSGTSTSRHLPTKKLPLSNNDHPRGFEFKAQGAGMRQRRHSTGVTQPKPFTLQTDIRGQKTKEALEEARRQAQEAEQKPWTFRAHPLPLTTHVAPNTIKPTNPVFTMPEPFDLRSEKRHEQACELKELLAQQEEEQRRQQASFKARPVSKAEAFQPARSDRPLTTPDDVILLSDVRSRQRAEFDAELAEKQRQQQERLAAEEAERQAREEAEIKELRRKTQFKARPMPEYSSNAADLKLPPPQWTNPVAPKLATESRVQTRASTAGRWPKI